MAPVTPLLQCEPNPMELTRTTARTFMVHGTLELLLSTTSCSFWAERSSLPASVEMAVVTPWGVLGSSSAIGIGEADSDRFGLCDDPFGPGKGKFRSQQQQNYLRKHWDGERKNGDMPAYKQASSILSSPRLLSGNDPPSQLHPYNQIQRGTLRVF